MLIEVSELAYDLSQIFLISEKPCFSKLRKSKKHAAETRCLPRELGSESHNFQPQCLLMKDTLSEYLGLML